MTKNTSTKNTGKKISVSDVSDKNILEINRKSSVFTEYPTLSIESVALNKQYQAIAKRIADNKAEQAIIDNKQQAIASVQAVANEAWRAYYQTEMNTPYLNQTRMQGININTAMLCLTDAMPDRSKLHVTGKHNTRKTLSINGNGNSTKSRNENEKLVTETIIQYDGCSFNQLPQEVQSRFTLNTADMYNKLKPFFHTMRNGTGKGKFALLHSVYGNDLTDTILNETKQPMGLTLPDGQMVKTDTSSVRYMSLAINNF